MVGYERQTCIFEVVRSDGGLHIHSPCFVVLIDKEHLVRDPIYMLVKLGICYPCTPGDGVSATLTVG